jgi:hypothetical protein
MANYESTLYGGKTGGTSPDHRAMERRLEEERQAELDRIEAERVNSEEYIAQMPAASSIVEDYFKDKFGALESLGFDPSPEDFEELGEGSISWSKIRQGYDDPDQGDADAYKEIAKSIKSRFGESSWYGGWSASDEFSKITETELDALIKRGFDVKALEESRKASAAAHVRLKEEIAVRSEDPRFATTEATEATYEGLNYGSLGPEKQKLWDLNSELEKLGREKFPTIEDIRRIDELNSEIDKQRELVAGDGAVALYDYYGNSIEAITEAEPDPNGFAFTEDELATEKERRNDGFKASAEGGDGAIDAPTYVEYGRNLLAINHMELAQNDFDGERVSEPFIVNDPEAWEYLAEYKTGENKHGFIYSNVPMSVLSSHWNRIVASDGDNAGGSKKHTLQEQQAFEAGYEQTGGANIFTGNKFDSPLGHVGLLENYEDQKFGFLESKVYSEDMKAKHDLSLVWKYSIRDHRDDRREILKNRTVLTDMFKLNIDVANVDRGGLDFFKQGLKVAGDGLKGDLSQWVGADKFFEKWDEPTYDSKNVNHKEFTKRASLDVLEGLEQTYGGLLSDEDKGRVKRSIGYKTWEGFTGFLPALGEFALIDVAAKKAGIVTAIPRLAVRAKKAFSAIGVGAKASKNIRNTTNFLGHAFYEEAKMRVAFDEHYHAGGGVAFYGIGKALPFIKFANPNWTNLVNNIGKSGVAGSLSVQGAQNLEALFADIAGNKTFQTHLNETYFNPDGEFKLSETLQQALVDFLVFGALGIKGMAKQSEYLTPGYTRLGRINPLTQLGLAPMRSKKVKGRMWPQKLRGKIWWKGIEQVKDESLVVRNNVQKAMDVAFEAGDKERVEELAGEWQKWNQVYQSSMHSLGSAWRFEDWQDDSKATKMVNASFEGVKKIIDPKGEIEFVAAKVAPEWVSEGGKNEAAEISADRKKIWINTTKAEPGKMPHEVMHYGLRGLMKGNPEAVTQLRVELAKTFDKQKIFDMKTGEELFIKDIVDHYKFSEAQEKAMGDKGMNKRQILQAEKDMKNEEYVAYVFEALANPLNYSRFVSSNKYNDLGKAAGNILEKAGMKDYKIDTKEDLVNFFYSMSKAMANGKLTARQWELFQGLDKQPWLKEPLGADMRTEESKKEDFVQSATNSKDFKELAAKSKTIQDKFNGLTKELGKDKAISEMLKPDPSKPTTSISKDFDAIIYNVIKKYNVGRVIKGLEDQQVLDPVDQYMLATELVYNLSANVGTKARGLEQMIKDYNPAKYGKTEAEYPLTKHVMQQLAKRVYELKEKSIDAGTSEGDVYQTISFSQEGVLAAAEAASANRGYTNFADNIDLKDNVKSTIELDGKTYNFPIKINEAMGIADFMPVKTKQAIDDLSFKDLTFMGIGKKLAPDVKDMMLEGMGLDVNSKPGDFVSKAREWFENKEELSHEMIPRTSNPEMYENSMIGKTIFGKLFKNTGVVFKSSELPDWLTKETNARSEKWEKRDYVKGELNDLLFNGRDNTVRKKNIIEFVTQVARVNSSQIAREAINNKAIQDLIQNKDAATYHKLKLESDVIPYVKEAIRGAVDVNMQSKDIAGMVTYELGVWNKFVNKTKDLNFNAYETVADGFYALKFSMTNKEQVVLEKNWDKLAGVKGYKFSGDIMKSYSDRAEALREMGAITSEPIVPTSFRDMNDVTAKIIPELAKLGWHPEDTQRYSENASRTNKDRRNDKDFIEKYHEALQDIAKTLDPASYKIFINSIGNSKYKFLNSDKVMTAAERDAVFKDVVSEFKEPKEGELGFGLKPQDVKLSDNGLFKAFVIETAPKFNLETPAGRKAYAKELEKWLTPRVTKPQAAKGVKKATLSETELANQLLQETVYSKLVDYFRDSKDPVNALTNIQFLLQLQTSIGDGFARGSATHTSVTLEMSKELHSEHEFQVLNFNGNFLLNMIKNSGSKEQFAKEFRKLSKIYKQSIITEEARDVQDADGTTTMKEGYNSHMSSKALYLLSDLQAAKTLDIKSGKTEKELTEQAIGINRTLKEIEVIRTALLKQLNAAVPGASNSKNLSTIPEVARKIAAVKEAFRLAGVKGRVKKGISVFDFDDTLAKSNSQVLYTLPGGKKGKLSATEFAKKSSILEDKGAIFDFSQFNKVIDGKKGPLFDLATRRESKFGSKDIFILTARPAESANAIHKFLKGVGLEIPLENIKGLADGKPSAKAMWILDKASEGYNDFYFADDAYKNTKAVKDVLDVIDVKGKVQLALNSKNTSDIVNEMIERKFGIGKEKRYSASKAQVVGDRSGKTKMMASSAQDFEGLLYRMLGKGKQGDADMAFLKEKLMTPFSKANNALASDRIAMVNDFRAMKKELSETGVDKDLSKEIPGEPFTVEQAIRVHIWKKQGMEVPDLSKADNALLSDYVTNQPALARFAEQLISLGKGDGYQAPKKSWLAGTITTDLYEPLNRGRRAEYLEEWQGNVDMIFSPENMNKMQAALGTSWRSAMENMLGRMKTGRNRVPMGGKMGEMEDAALDWINASVGSIMFLNTRSAVLQTISTINYVNWHDNNPLMAGKAFANQKQYWKDYVKLITSDFMVERRGGNQINVNESEIADAAKKGGVQGTISYLLNKGFVMTRAADSHAIASGGATFFRNRLNTYKKQGLTEAEAEKKAFSEFREITEESQQSSRVDRISMQQASNLGRVVLAFANTPSQYARIMQKAASDLKNGRGDWKENISKIIYYGAVQNLIFNALQNALFKDAFDGDDTIDTDTGRIASGMIDSILRGGGWQGAALATLKGLVMDVRKQSQKDRPKYADSALKLLDMSPPIDSKISKLRSAGRALDYDMDEIQEKGMLDLTNPAYLAGGQVVSAVTNLPLDRMFKKYNNIEAALREDQETWKSMALALGWSEWELESASDEEISFLKGMFKKGSFKKSGTFKKGSFKKSNFGE